jgi:putative colanic acid biosysnthesis UDP-glucose lipid carrier transferase
MIYQRTKSPRPPSIDLEDHTAFYYISPEPLEIGANRVIKRAFDIVFSVIIIVGILSWLIPLLAIGIKLSSRGPVFFKQLRSGRNNQPFTCWKLRTLTESKDAHTRDVTEDDQRTTRLGRLLRKSNLDELPQFINVLMADMSVVGPRPHMLAHTQIYSEIRGDYMMRHHIKPGITGWAQVMGYRGQVKNEIQLRKRVDHDLWYKKNWTLLLDMKIVWRTVLTTLRGDKNAY